MYVVLGMFGFIFTVYNVIENIIQLLLKLLVFKHAVKTPCLLVLM